jgi:uncharacterized YkwD family protein
MRRKLFFFVALILGLSACNIASGGKEPDAVTFAQRSESMLTPMGGPTDDLDEENSAPRNLLLESGTSVATEIGEIQTGTGESQNQILGETPTPTNTLTDTATITPSVLPTSTSTLIPRPTPTYTLPPPPTNTNTPVPKPSPTKTLEPQPTNTTASTTCSPTGNSSFESQVIALINQERAAEGLPALSSQSQLTSAARIHSADMASNNFFSHNSPTTGSPFDRITDQGYHFSMAGENIAGGYESPTLSVESWMNSPGHRANILDENYIHIGIGYAYCEDSTYGSYWTAVFASP